jgi:5'-nucleotidase
VEGAILGIPSYAISLAARRDFDFGPSARFAVRLARSILTRGLPRNTFLNVNVPARAGTGSYKITRMGKRIYGESVRELSNGWGRKYYLIGGNDPGYADTEDSDFQAIADNFISITPLHLDWTNYASFETLLRRKI